MTDITEIDPNAKRCPWCEGFGTRKWRGSHAARVHPEKWETFQEVYESEKVIRTVWVPKEGEYQIDNQIAVQVGDVEIPDSAEAPTDA